MEFDIGDVVNDGFERLATSVGAVVIVGWALFGIVRTAAGQDVFRAGLERLLEVFENPEFRDQLNPEQLQAVEELETEINASLADLPLALGLGPIAAVAVWLLAFVLGLVVVVVAMDAFGHERESFDEVDTDRLGWKTLNLFIGTVVFAILFVIGLFLLVLPGLVLAFLLVFFPAAIVINDESFFDAYGSSFSVARENIVGTLAIFAIGIATLFALGFVSTIFEISLPAVGAAIAGELLSAVGVAFVWALTARAFVDATRERADGDEPVPERPPGDRPKSPRDGPR
ncbi:hypothetical protein BRC65_05190 [Halobacteriales archaeon QH_2_65_14]|nr:MAG: hypothetical protein BRC65_05190 [Halobacteriales archaeon QH_2_65_14]